MWLHKLLTGDIMQKQRKMRLSIHKLRKKVCDVAMQEQSETASTKPKRYKILHGSIKHGKAIQIPVHRRSLQTASFRRAVERSIIATQKSGNPVARYDVQRKQAYLEYPDGSRTYVE